MVKLCYIIIFFSLLGCSNIDRKSEFVNGLAVFENTDSNKYGFIDEDNNIVIEAQYDYAQQFDGQFADVQNNGRSGIINKENKIIIPLKYDNITFVGDDYFVTRNYNRQGLYKVDKEIIPNIYAKIDYKVKSGRYITVYDSTNTTSDFFDYSNLGVYDLRKERLVTGLKYQTLDTIINNIAVFDSGRSSAAIIDIHNSENKINEFYVNGGYIEVYSDGSETFFNVFGGSATSMVLDNFGNKIIQGYNFISDYGEGLFVVTIRDGHYGYANVNNKLIIKAVFDKASKFENGKAVVTLHDATYTIDKRGKCIEGCPTEKWLKNYEADNLFIKPSTYDDLVEQGIELAKNQNFKKAIETFTEALSINPSGEKALFNRGLSYLQSANFTLSSYDLEIAHSLKPNDANICYINGVVYEKLQNYSMALHFFDKAVERNPYMADAYLKMAIIQQRIYNNTEKACINIIKACDLGNSEACEGKRRFCN
jgi:tetratricopeptide (TPR) repeat protein